MYLLQFFPFWLPWELRKISNSYPVLSGEQLQICIQKLYTFISSSLQILGYWCYSLYLFFNVYIFLYCIWKTNYYSYTYFNAFLTFIFIFFNFYTSWKWFMYHHYNIRQFCLCLSIYLYQWFLYVHMIYIVNYCPFISAWRAPFSVSCKTGLVVMNSLNFCLSSFYSFCSLHLQSTKICGNIFKDNNFMDNNFHYYRAAMDLRDYFKDEAWSKVIQNHNAKMERVYPLSQLFYSIFNKSWLVLMSFPPETESLTIFRGNLSITESWTIRKFFLNQLKSFSL